MRRRPPGRGDTEHTEPAGSRQDPVIQEAPELDYLRVSVDAVATGESLAFVRFFGEGVSLLCTELDELVFDYLPVGFMESVRLDDLDGVRATVTGALETTRGEFTTSHDVVLRVTDY